MNGVEELRIRHSQPKKLISCLTVFSLFSLLIVLLAVFTLTWYVDLQEDLRTMLLVTVT